MPQRDGTGPLGLGPKTGRGLGNCNCQLCNFNSPMGCLCCMNFDSPKNKLMALENEEKRLTELLEVVREEIKAIKSKAE